MAGLASGGHHRVETGLFFCRKGGLVAFQKLVPARRCDQFPLKRSDRLAHVVGPLGSTHEFVKKRAYSFSHDSLILDITVAGHLLKLRCFRSELLTMNI